MIPLGLQRIVHQLPEDEFPVKSSMGYRALRRRSAKFQHAGSYFRDLEQPGTASVGSFRRVADGRVRLSGRLAGSHALRESLLPRIAQQRHVVASIMAMIRWDVKIKIAFGKTRDSRLSERSKTNDVSSVSHELGPRAAAMYSPCT